MGFLLRLMHSNVTMCNCQLLISGLQESANGLQNNLAQVPVVAVRRSEGAGEDGEPKERSPKEQRSKFGAWGPKEEKH